MQFAAHFMNMNDRRKIESPGGIISILKKMAQGRKSNDFYDIVPWNVLNGDEDVQDLIWSLREAIKYTL